MLALLVGCADPNQQFVVGRTPSAPPPPAEPASAGSEPSVEPEPLASDSPPAAPPTRYEIRLREVEQTRIPRLGQLLLDRSRSFTDRRANLNELLALEEEFPGAGAREQVLALAAITDLTHEESALVGTAASTLARSPRPELVSALDVLARSPVEAARLAVAMAVQSAWQQDAIQSPAVHELAAHLREHDPSKRVRALLTDVLPRPVDSNSDSEGDSSPALDATSPTGGH